MEHNNFDDLGTQMIVRSRQLEILPRANQECLLRTSAVVFVSRSRIHQEIYGAIEQKCQTLLR